MANKLNQFTTHSSQFTNFAFTLAETLIVMGIIGVVAALTLPNLNSSTGDKEKVTKVKKIYSNLNDAFGRVEGIYGNYTEWYHPSGNGMFQLGDRMTDFLKISKSCNETKASNDGCFAKNVDDTVDIDAKAFVLADGTSVAHFLGSFFVDIDGPNKGKNKFGEDIFLFYANNETGEFGYTDPNYDISTDAKLKENCFNSNSTKYGCAGWIIQIGNMDYLKVDNNGKCPNGTILSWTNTTCK